MEEIADATVKVSTEKGIKLDVKVIDRLLQVKEAKREKHGGIKDKIYWVGNEE